MLLACPQWANGSGYVLRQAKDRSFEAMINNPEDVARIAQWIQSRWIKKFRLAGKGEVAMSNKLKQSGRGEDGVLTD